MVYGRYIMIYPVYGLYTLSLRGHHLASDPRNLPLSLVNIIQYIDVHWSYFAMCFLELGTLGTTMCHKLTASWLSWYGMVWAVRGINRMSAAQFNSWTQQPNVAVAVPHSCQRCRKTHAHRPTILNIWVTCGSQDLVLHGLTHRLCFGASQKWGTLSPILVSHETWKFLS